MGDSRIVVRFCRSRRGYGRESEGQSAQHAGCSVEELLNVQLAADSTLREVADRIEDALNKDAGGTYAFLTRDGKRRRREQDNGVDDSNAHGLAAFDCTYNPPKEITATIAEYDSKMGPRCKTLHSMGWFPSGSITVVPQNDQEARKEVITSRLHQMEHDSTEQQPVLSSLQRPVQWTGSLARAATGDGDDADESLSNPPLPSQIMKAVEQRFGHSEDANLSAAAMQQPPSRRHRTEDERCARIDGILQRMEASNAKTSATTQQVKRMLIKSRAKGDGRLRMEDRFHLEVVQLDETVEETPSSSYSPSSSSYRYFSRVALVGKVLDEVLDSSSSTVPSDSEKSKSVAELLVKIPAPGVKERHVYRRLPNLMPLHQAQDNKYLSEFDRVIVRTLPVSGQNHDGAEPTPFITDSDFGDATNGQNEASESTNHVENNDGEGGERLPGASETPLILAASTATTAQEEHGMQVDEPSSDEALDLARALEEYDAMQANKKKGSSTTKKSKTVDKVRQMLIKGKAKGDKKLVKENDRFYLEVLLVVPGETAAPVQMSSSSYIFLSFSATVDRISGQVSIPWGGSRQYWVKKEGDDVCTKLPNDAKLRDAESSGLLHPFDRVIVRVTP